MRENHPTREKVPFLAWGDFHARSELCGKRDPRVVFTRAVKGPQEFFSLEIYGRMDMDICSIENLQTTHRFASAGAHD